MKPSIGFIGLGAMGLPMAINLKNAGYPVFGMDISTACSDHFAKAGGTITQSVEQIVSSSEIIVTMLPTGEHVKACLENLIQAGLKDKLLIDFSTIGVEYSLEIHRLCDEHGLRCLDAPVTGGVIGAEKGTLTLMVGGTRDNFEAAQPIFQAVGKSITYAGGPSCGQAVKVCNNMAAGIIKIAISEAFALAKSLGVDENVLFDVASKGSANCFALTTTCPVPGLVPNAPSSHGYKGGFATKLMLKDMKLAQNAASTRGVATTLGAVATSLYEHCAGAGLGDLDNSIVFKFITKDY